MEVHAHIAVQGMVQGVGFRYFAFTHAQILGLKGYVRNLDNGDVEIEVEGDRSLIEEFIVLVKAGPRSAEVRDIKVRWSAVSHQFSIFEIR